MPELTSKQILLVTIALAALMVLTRSVYFGLSVVCANASMAVFFLGGVYLRRHRLFAAMLVLAAATDMFSVAFAGLPTYLFTRATLAEPLSYALLWYGARALATRGLSRPWLLAAALPLVSLAFLTTNASFYWLSGLVPGADMTGWWANFTQWAGLFIGTSMAYVGIPLVLHEVASRLTATDRVAVAS